MASGTGPNAQCRLTANLVIERCLYVVRAAGARSALRFASVIAKRKAPQMLSRANGLAVLFCGTEPPLPFMFHVEVTFFFILKWLRAIGSNFGSSFSPAKLFVCSFAGNSVIFKAEGDNFVGGGLFF